MVKLRILRVVLAAVIVNMSSAESSSSLESRNSLEFFGSGDDYDSYYDGYGDTNVHTPYGDKLILLYFVGDGCDYDYCGDYSGESYPSEQYPSSLLPS